MHAAYVQLPPMSAAAAAAAASSPPVSLPPSAVRSPAQPVHPLPVMSPVAVFPSPPQAVAVTTMGGAAAVAAVAGLVSKPSNYSMHLPAGGMAALLPGSGTDMDVAP